MKKILSLIIFTIILISPFRLYAQTSECSTTITAQTQYDDCCNNGGGTGQASASSCNVWENANGMSAGNDGATTSSNGALPQQIGGGAPSTSPINGAAANTSLGNTGTPSTSNAAASCSAIQFNTLLDYAIWAKCIIGAVIIPGIFTLAFAVFLWGVFKFIRASEDKDKQESKQFIYMGLIGLFVMVSVWGIINILTTTFGITALVPALQTDYLSPSNASTSTTAPAITPTSSGSGTSQ